MTERKKLKWEFIAVIVLAVVAGLISYPKAVERVPKLYSFLNKTRINLGLDLQGGIHLEYSTDLSQISDDKKADALSAIQDVIERRVNAFGVAEPVVYTTKSGSDNRLVVELAGVKDIDQAKAMIKDTPFLEFKEESDTTPEQIPQDVLDQENAQAKAKAQQILDQAKAGADFAQLAKDNSEDPGSASNGGDLGFVKKSLLPSEFEKVLFDSNLGDGQIYPDPVETQTGWYIVKKIEQRGEGDDAEVHIACIIIDKKTQPEPQQAWVSTGLTGKNLEKAFVDYQSNGLGQPVVALQFDSEGSKLFDEITKRNIGKPVAIYLDGEIVSDPVVNDEISNGRAQISGNFTLDKAKDLVKSLNEGALPVPISLVSQQSVEASLGAVSLEKSLKAGAVGLALVVIFMLAYYRFLGLIASVALLIYTALMIAIFKLSILTPWSITLTLPGIAGFVLSIGMAVDANILIFERTKEEIRRGRNVVSAIHEGFKRAWTSIRDGNVSSIITSLILINLGTGFVKGFAITLILGVLVSMFTAVAVSRTLLEFFMGEWMESKLWLIGAKRGNTENEEKKK